MQAAVKPQLRCKGPHVLLHDDPDDQLVIKPAVHAGVVRLSLARLHPWRKVTPLAAGCCRALREEHAQAERSLVHREQALESMTQRCSEHAARVTALEAQAQASEAERAQLQAAANSECAAAREAGSAAAAAERKVRGLQKAAADDKAYHEVRNSPIKLRKVSRSVWLSVTPSCVACHQRTALGP